MGYVIIKQMNYRRIVMRLDYKNGLSFEIYIMDLIEAYKSDLTSASDLNDFSEDLHQRIEMAIQDYIYDDENLDIDDYEAPY